MIKAENKDNSRSVEHLIPNAVLTKKRKNDEGDFYACRKCNSRKSNIDYILGIITKCQVDDDELAASTLIKAVTKEDGASKRFINMARNVVEGSNEVYMDIPIKGEELVEYIHFIGKGQYFKKHRKAYNPDRFVMKILFANKQVTRSLQESYIESHKSNPFRDLEKNKFSEVIYDGECIIYSKNKGYMFVFHDYTTITVKILNKNRKNMMLTKKKTNEIISYFNKHT
jgi:hypothetical protein